MNKYDESLHPLIPVSDFEKLMVCEAALEAQTREGKKIVQDLLAKNEKLKFEIENLKRENQINNTRNKSMLGDLKSLRIRLAETSRPAVLNEGEKLKVSRYDRLVNLCRDKWAKTPNCESILNHVRNHFINNQPEEEGN